MHPLDFDLHRDIAAHTATPLATGENLFSRDDARNLVRYGGLRRDRDRLQFDISTELRHRRVSAHPRRPRRAGLAARALRRHAGHLLAMNAVAGLGLGLAEVAMDTSTLFGRLTAHVPVSDGTATLSDAPGAGFETAPDVFRNLRRSSELDKDGRSAWNSQSLFQPPDDIKSLVRPDHVHRRAYADPGGVCARAGAHLQQALDLRGP